MKKSKNRIEITQRDIDFFCYLHSLKVATIDQIGRDCYEQLAQPGLYKRLLRLEKEGMIQGIISSSSNGKKVYNLRAKSFKKYVHFGEVKRCELKSDAIKHDLGLVDIRHIIVKSRRVKKYLSENSLQTWPIKTLGDQFGTFVQNNSDAAVEVSVDDVSLYFAVEYEISFKNNQRYEEKIHTYYAETGITMVLYVLPDNDSVQTMMKFEKAKDEEQKAKFFYTTFDKLVKNQDMSFINWKGDKINF
jgi:hypothetical protein